MRYYPFPDHKWTRAAFCGYLLAMLYLVRESMFTLSVWGFYKAQFLMFGLMGALGIWFAVRNFRSLKEILTDGRVKLALIASGAVLLPMVLKRDWQAMYISVLICVLFPIFLSYFVTLRQTAKAYVVIFVVLGAYSVLATYILRWLMDQGWFSVSSFHNPTGYRFYNFGLACVAKGFVKDRNFGIFREPGVYQYFLVLGLFLNEYKVIWDKPWKKRTAAAILAVTLVTTFATGGVLSLGLFGLLLFFEKKLYKNWKIDLAIAVCVLIGLGFAAYCIAEQNKWYWQVYDMLVGKFLGGQDSSVERLDALAFDLQLFGKHPIAGAAFAQVLEGTANNTTSSLVQLAAFGILGVWLHVAGWLTLAWDKKRSLIVNLGMTGILFLSFNTQNLTADLFFWLFPMLALAETWVPKLEKGRKA